MYPVLLVDPNDHSREKIKKMVEWNRWGFVVKACARSFADAAAWTTGGRFSLVLINIRRDCARGLQLCDEIRQTSRVPIILVGGKRSFHLARKALLRKVSDYLPDPVSSDELHGSLKTVKRELERDSAYYFGLSGENPQALTSPIAGRDARSPANIIDQVKAYVNHSLHENITLKEIARSLHFNSSYLGQKFKEHEKMTFNEYLLRQRMERAKTLLAHTRMKVYEIANEVGYSDLDWFYKKFKAYTGVSANQYRKLFSDTA